MAQAPHLCCHWRLISASLMAREETCKGVEIKADMCGTALARQFPHAVPIQLLENVVLLI